MKQTICIFLIALLSKNISIAQDSNIAITGPTCLQVGDTVMYWVSKPIPNYHWSYPSGLNFLYSAADNSSATYVVNAVFNNGEMLWYGPMFQNIKGAITLQLYAKASKPFLRLTTDKQQRIIFDQIPARAQQLNIHISPQSIEMGLYQYELSSSNASWTFENEKVSILPTSKSFGNQIINLNVGNGSTIIKIKTTGTCKTRTDEIELVKRD